MRRLILSIAFVALGLLPALALYSSSQGHGTVSASAQMRATPHAVSATSSTTISHGIKVTFSVPRISYPRDSLVPTNITLRNVSGKTAQIVDDKCERIVPHTDVLQENGQPYAWPLPIANSFCTRNFNTVSVAPGMSYIRTSIVYLQGNVIRAVAYVHVGPANASEMEQINSSPLRLMMTKREPEHATLASTQHLYKGVSASVWPGHKQLGKLYFAQYDYCDGKVFASSQGTTPVYTWLATKGARTPTDQLSPWPCLRDEQWRVIVGWLGHTAARLNLNISSS